MKAFIDTNVLIDLVCNRDKFYDDAESVFALGLSGVLDIYFTDISVVNTLYVGKKYGYTQEELCRLLTEILRFSCISKMDSRIVMSAISSEWSDKEDAIQYYSAKASGADYLITRNVKDFSLSDIKVLSPHDFLVDLTLE